MKNIKIFDEIFYFMLVNKNCFSDFLCEIIPSHPPERPPIIPPTTNALTAKLKIVPIRGSLASMV